MRWPVLLVLGWMSILAQTLCVAIRARHWWGNFGSSLCGGLALGFLVSYLLTHGGRR